MSSAVSAIRIIAIIKRPACHATVTMQRPGCGECPKAGTAQCEDQGKMKQFHGDLLCVCATDTLPRKISVGLPVRRVAAMVIWEIGAA